MITAEQAVAVSILSCVAGAVLTLVVSRSKTVAGWLAFLVTAGTAVLIFSATARVLTAGPSLHPFAFWSMPKFGFALRIHVDGLTAVFLILTGLVAVPASFYSIIYMRHYQDYGVARYYPYSLLFLAAMYGLLSTADMMWFFFIFWQMMALSAYALIRFEHRKRGNVSAAIKFLVAMELACAAVMVGVGLLAQPSPAAGIGAALRYDLDTLSVNLPLLVSASPGTTAPAFTLFLIGFGILMGMWPFGQFWLPDAAPAAPAPVSALISGVMIKIGVYGLLRYFLWIVPMHAQADYPLATFGVLVTVLGTITLFTGTMQALKQEQSKRLLAFHSIGQIGYILLGTGTCMVLLPATAPAAVALATLAFFGALFHVVNHGLFKGLLFLNAGSMLHATGTQDLNQMGGMMKYMPLTALTALVASFSISGVPLFNGFVSKWIIYVAAIQGSGSARYLVVCAVIAILTSALTLASFIKFFGASFLSRTSALVKAQAASGRLEVPWMMQLPQLVLAFFCVLLGVVPAIGFRLMQHALEASRGGLPAVLAGASPMVNGPLTGLAETSGAALFSPLVLVAVLGVMFLVVYGISKLGSAPRRAADPWLCGYVREADCYRYSAHNFYGEIKRYFGWLGGAPHAHADKPSAVKELS